VPEALLLRSQIANVRRRGGHLERDAFRHVDSVRAELLDFRGVVRHELDRRHPEDPEHAGGTLVTPKIRREAEDSVRVDRVETVVLEVVRRDLIHDPDAASLLSEIQQDALRRVPDSLHRGIELLAAVASFRTEDIARHAFGVEAHEDIGLPCDVPLHERHVLLAREWADECVDPEVPVAGRKPSLAAEENVVAEFGFEARHGPPFRRFRPI